MSQNRKLIEDIKARFARKSTDQLQVIQGDREHRRWSAEAVVAASELFKDRQAGVAHGPDKPDDTEDDPPEYHYDQDLMALGLLSGLFTGVIIVPNTRREEHVEHPDLPAPFGPKMAWLVVATNDTEAVAKALGLRQLTSASWEQGVDAAHRGSVFVTPPVGDWTLLVGTPLFQPPDQTATGVAAMLETFGRHFDEVQYFSSLSDAGLFVWGLCRQGELLRGYGWLGAQGRELWNVGAPTDEELELGFQFNAGQPPLVDPGDGGEFAPFSEECLIQLAARWSVDPMSLDGEFAEPVSGLLGKLPSPTTTERRRLE